MIYRMMIIVYIYGKKRSLPCDNVNVSTIG